jgi:hypothetical protein
MASSFSRLATVTASTKRNPATNLATGLRSTPATEIASLSCTPLDPVDPEVRRRLQLETPHELLETFVDGSLDIKEGDILVVGSTEYPIKSVAEWTWQDSKFLHLVIEELKK